MTLDLSPLPQHYRTRVRRLHTQLVERAAQDELLAAAYDEAVKVHGYPNALDEVAEAEGVTPSRVRVAKWGK